MSKHRSRLSKSPRLQKVLVELKAAGKKGRSTFELQNLAMVTDVKDIIYELKDNGVSIRSEQEGRHKRYFFESEEVAA